MSVLISFKVPGDVVVFCTAFGADFPTFFVGNFFATCCEAF